MKKLNYFLTISLFSVLTVFASCSNQNHPTGNTVSKKDLLTRGTWKLVKYTIGGEDVTNSLYKYFEKDDFLRFNEDGSLIYTDAGYKSYPAGDKITQWDFSDDQTKLHEDGIGDFQIEELTSNTIKLSTDLAGMKNVIVMSH